MDFLFDHDMPDPVGRMLVALGHRVIHVRDILPITTADPAIFRVSLAKGWVMATCNICDYAPLARRELANGTDIPGVIFLIRRGSTREECARVRMLLERVGPNGLHGQTHYA